MIPRVTRLLKRLRLGRPIESGSLQLVHTSVLGTRVTFCVEMENDPIQRNHRRGHFYEIKELAKLRRVFPEGGVFVDIGANVGNHTLFAALMLKAREVIPLEPNPLAYELLIQNVLVNRLDDVVTLDHLGVGLSDKHAGGYAMQDRERNLGGARMLKGKGELEVYPGDTLLADVSPDLVKIDVEGMEMQVLAGLEELIARARPMMMVEVDNTSEDAFLAWVIEHGYDVLSTHQRYRLNKNHLIVDAARVDELKPLYFAEGADDDLDDAALSDDDFAEDDMAEVPA